MWNKLGHLSGESISNLNDYYEQNQSGLKVINWFNVRSAKLLILDLVDDPTILEASLEMYDLIGDDRRFLYPKACYILEYYEGSFTRLHKDSIGEEDTDSLTTVTLIHQSDDLSGGKALFMDKDKSITILDQDIGEVLSYNHRIMHGVSKISKGTRRVWINWYTSKADKVNDRSNSSK